MPFILVCSITLWVLILERYWFLLVVHPKELARACLEWKARRARGEGTGTCPSLRSEERHSRTARRLRAQKIAHLVAEARQSLPMIRTLILVLPLLGLLGTVSGMIHTFEVITLFGGANRRGIATGIAEALVATLSGLITALSGLYFSVNLESRARAIRAKAEALLRSD